MALKEFVFQGFSKRTHTDVVHELFDVEDIKSVLVSVAFVNESGVEEVVTKLEAHSDKLTVFAGIRNDVTTQQGVSRLFHLKGSAVYTVDTGARHLIFHPKIYMVRGAKEARLSIGSANMTLGGLHNNIEAGLVLHFDLADASERKTLEDIEAQFMALPKKHANNIVLVDSDQRLQDLMDDGLLLDEMEARPPRPASSKSKGQTSDTVSRIQLETSFKRGKLRAAKAKAKPAPPPAPATTPGKAKAKSAAAPAVTVSPSVGVGLELVWESKDLEARDVNIPEKGKPKPNSKGKGTNKTGSLSLDKGRLHKDVDHRHYFRDKVFPALDWQPATATTEEAYARFQVTIKNVDYGEHILRVAHTTSTDTVSYYQKNAMSRLSWGTVMPIIEGNESLIDGTLSLYRDQADPTRFAIEID